MVRGYHLFDKWLVEARGSFYPEEILDLYIPLTPISKERPRGVTHYTPQKTRTWTTYFGKIVGEMMAGRPEIDFPISARVIFGLTEKRLNSKRPPDTDNLEKALWDALQKGDSDGKNKAFTDDKYIRGYIEKSERITEPHEEFIWVRLYARSVDDYTKYDEACEQWRHE